VFSKPIELEGLEIRHQINRRLKHAYLRVEEDGTVVLKSNGKNSSGLQAFVTSKREWIARQRQALSSLPRMQVGESILYLGRLLPLSEIALHRFAAETPEAMRRSYDRFYRTTAEAFLEERTRFFAGKMGIDYREIRLRKMKRRWGSCSKTGVITYNTLLMQLEEEMIEYTVVHELAHRVHFNHSAAFHALVASVLSGEKLLRQQIRRRKALYY